MDAFFGGRILRSLGLVGCFDGGFGVDHARGTFFFQASFLLGGRNHFG